MDEIINTIKIVQRKEFGSWDIYVNGILQCAPFSNLAEVVEYLATKPISLIDLEED